MRLPNNQNLGPEFSSSSKDSIGRFVRGAWDVACKDIRIEWRTKEIVYTTGFFAAVLVIVFSFAFSGTVGVTSAAVPGILWVSIAFSGTIALTRTFDREREGDTMRGLLMSPMPRTAIMLGKMMAIVAIMFLVQIVILPLVGILFGAQIQQAPGLLLATLVLGTVGFSIIGTVFSAMLLGLPSRDVLLPVVLYPILIPLFIASTKATAVLLGPVEMLGDCAPWLRFLAVYDVLFMMVGLWTFESLVME